MADGMSRFAGCLWYRRDVKRTFQVAVFGASNAANKKTLASWQRARGGELIEVPSVLAHTTRFFDYELAADRGLRARFRVRMVTDSRLEGQAFLALIGSDAVVLVPGGTHDADAWREAQEHLATYGDLPVIVASSSRAVREVKGVPAAAGGLPLAEAVEREVIAAFRARRIKGRPTSSPSKSYVTRANALAEAAQLATEIGPRSMLRLHRSIRASALHPDLGFATVSSLASLEPTLFTFWNESHGPHVATFWREIARRGLPFRRRDVIGEVLARGRITNRNDYDTVTDLIADEQLTATQRRRLDSMLGAYGNARAGR